MPYCLWRSMRIVLMVYLSPLVVCRGKRQQNGLGYSVFVKHMLVWRCHFLPFSHLIPFWVNRISWKLRFNVFRIVLPRPNFMIPNFVSLRIRLLHKILNCYGWAYAFLSLKLKPSCSNPILQRLLQYAHRCTHSECFVSFHWSLPLILALAIQA